MASNFVTLRTPSEIVSEGAFSGQLLSRADAVAHFRPRCVSTLASCFLSSVSAHPSRNRFGVRSQNERAERVWFHWWMLYCDGRRTRYDRDYLYWRRITVFRLLRRLAFNSNYRSILQSLHHLAAL